MVPHTLLIAAMLACPVDRPDQVRVAEIVQARAYTYKNPMSEPETRLIANVATNASCAVPLPIILAVIEVESKWDPKAKSKKKCKGLMQLARRTAKNLADKLGMAHHDVFDPAHNLLLGVAFLQELITQNKGNWLRALTVYNMGWGNFVSQGRKVSGYARLVAKKANYFQRLLNQDQNFCRK